MATKATKTDSTPAPDARDDTTDGPVTEAAQVDTSTKDETLKQMAGVSDTQYDPSSNAAIGPSQQQSDAFENLKQTRGELKDPTKRDERLANSNPLAQGPGGMVA